MVNKMLEHIVKNGERIEEIMDLYRVSYETIKSYNLHITDFKNLICGMKIKVPLITEEVEQILENTESFVKEYYPKIVDVVEEVEIIPDKKEIEVDIVQNVRGKPYPGIVPPKYIKKE